MSRNVSTAKGTELLLKVMSNFDHPQVLKLMGQ